MHVISGDMRSDACSLDDDTLRLIIDAAATPLAYVDRDRRFQLVNAAYRAQLGLRGDVRDRDLAEVLGGELYARIVPDIERALSGTPTSCELRLETAGARTMRADFVPCLRDDGVRGFVWRLHEPTPAERRSLLSDAIRALAAPIDLASTQETIARVAIPSLADLAIVFLERDGAIVPVELAPDTECVRALANAFTPDARSDHPVCLALRSGQAVALDRPDDPAAVAIAIVPLTARGRALGALLVARDHGFTDDEVALLEELGRRAGSVLNTAQVFEAVHATNQRLAEAVAHQRDADRRKDEFLAILGHELRNPLAPITVALDLMAMSGAQVFERERQVIKRHTEAMTRLVDDLLDVSRASREKIQLHKRPVELAVVIGQAVEVAGPLLEQRRHRLIVDVPRNGLVVEADPIRLGQVFVNLLINAAKYTEPGGNVVIAAIRDGDEVAICVEDTGHGITKGSLGDIFNPFVQSERTIDRAQGGLGLGLALVRSLTELHGGRVAAYSDGPGTGSRFVVRLAAYDGAPEHDASLSSLVGRSARVLVVDDNADAANSMASVLRGAGYEVAIAHDAPEALLVAATFRPAIAMLDIGLPVMDGYELAHHLRGCLPHPPRLIAVSGYGNDDLIRSRAAGFDVHLDKPIRFDTLVHVLGYLGTV